MNAPIDDLEASRAPLLDHLIELRRRLFFCIVSVLVALIGTYIYSREIFTVLVHPLLAAGQKRIVTIGVFDGFFVQLKVALFAAIMISFPVIANQLWGFVAPGLYRKEKRALLPFLFATPVLFILGASMAYFVAIPSALHFFLSFQGNLGGVEQEALTSVASYLDFVMQFLFAFGLAFLLPILLMLVERAGLVTRKQLVSGRRYAIVGCFAVALVLAPPDAGSMIILAIPLVALYELALIAIWFTERRRGKEAATELVES
ncbi:sec-independent protein translocase protein TatC [Sphingomonas sp. BE270]|uniref:twin-arginine translocase subunit TatC n=1 Tax=unclassified Sphingomonas TaxID=196159 RepID=UPI0010F93237|nr:MULTISPECIES: twin-arginine translocase subunit TatC [unclassified Sphingomonas]MDR6847386.1 sec-independent protein translocase protein TatC [Sphingomonas sp. BE137]MDR7256930.1 sec-independent protein translocase protein TatC [Sphingomonas sp. BE270]